MRAWAVWLVALAGCASAPAADEPGALIVEDPRDYEYDDAGGHMHDYWRGQDRMVVMDAAHDDLGPGLSGGDDVVVHEYRPAAGDVVPQGTASVEVRLEWQDDALDRYTAPTLWVQTAADREPWKAGDIASGETMLVALNESAWDLPHQLLSAWTFQLRMSDDGGVLRFKGTTHILVEAVRGLPLPVYPPHPDAWQGRSEILLLDERHGLAYAHDPVDGGCNGISCQQVHAPADGELVPHNASLVEVLLEHEGERRFTLGLQHHGGEGREWQRIPPAEDGVRRVYRIDPAGAGDGPYARQSLWEFMVYIEGPLTDGAAVQDYRITVTASR